MSRTQEADFENLSDPLMLQLNFTDVTEREIESALGAQFLQAVKEMPAGIWQGSVLIRFCV
jgi:hypothetical protein